MEIGTTMIQTRSEVNGLSEYPSVAHAFEAAKRDNSIWKISFNAEDGSQVRLVKENLGTNKLSEPIWVYESLLESMYDLMKFEKDELMIDDPRD